MSAMTDRELDSLRLAIQHWRVILLRRFASARIELEARHRCVLTGAVLGVEIPCRLSVARIPEPVGLFEVGIE